MPDTLSFTTVKSDWQEAALMPCVNGTALSALACGYERTRDDGGPIVNYCGVTRVGRVKAGFSRQELFDCFLGLQESVESEGTGEIYLVDCSCGWGGCWPLVGHVVTGSGQIRWERFGNPFVPERDYGGFGPFAFGRDQYLAALVQAADLMQAAWAEERDGVASPGGERWIGTGPERP